MTEPNETTQSGLGGPVHFPATLWTVVLEAKQSEPDRAQKAVGQLAAHYREAILDYFRLKCRHHEDAEDLTGDFIAHLLERSSLVSFDKEACPRFRAYLSVALRNFFGDWLRKRAAAKRGDGTSDESVELLREGGVEFAMDDAQLRRAVDLGFTRLVHQRVMKILKDKAQNPKRFEVLRDFIPFEHGSESYEQTARQMGLTLGAFRKAVFDQRKSYVQLFRAEVAPTVRSVRVDLDAEARDLLELLPEAVVLEDHPGLMHPSRCNARAQIT